MEGDFINFGLKPPQKNPENLRCWTYCVEKASIS